MALAELLVSLSVIAMLASAAYPAFQRLRQRREVVHAADLLVASIDLARAAAVARRDAVTIVPLSPAAGFAGGWRVVPGEGQDGTALSVVKLRSGCLRIGLDSSGGPGRALRLAAVGYSRSERGGFYAATFRLRCGGAQRQVSLNALGRLRICTPGRDADCNGADHSNPTTAAIGTIQPQQ